MLDLLESFGQSFTLSLMNLQKLLLESHTLDEFGLLGGGGENSGRPLIFIKVSIKNFLTNK